MKSMSNNIINPIVSIQTEKQGKDKEGNNKVAIFAQLTSLGRYSVVN